MLMVAVAAFTLVLGLRLTGGISQGSAVNSGPRLTPDWVTLANPTPAAVLAAAQRTPLYRAAYDAPQTGLGHILRTGELGTPVFVHAYRPTPSMTDVWVIPVYPANTTQPPPPVIQTTGAATPASAVYPLALLDFAYDVAHARIRPLTFAGPFAPSDPEYHRPFPALSAAQALIVFSHNLSAQGVHAVQQPGVAGVTGATSAQLVYFPLNLDAVVGPHATVAWGTDGAFADTPTWLVQGSNGQAYFVAADGRVLRATQAPYLPNAASH